MRPWRALLAIGVAAMAFMLLAPGRAAAAGGVTRDDAIAELQDVRISIDETLALFKAGRDAEAFEKARSGYLNALRSSSRSRCGSSTPTLTVEAEALFAETRQLVRSDAPVGEVRAKLVELRGRHRRRPSVASPTAASGAPAIVVRPVVPHHLPRGPRGRPAPLGAARLSGVGEGGRIYRRPVLVGVGLAAGGAGVPSSRCSASSPPLPGRPRAARGHHRRSSPWPCSSTCRSG